MLERPREETQRESSVCQSPSQNPLAFGSHQRPQGSPNEVKTTNISQSLACLHLFSPPSRRRRKGYTSLVCMFSWLYQI